MGKSQVPNPPGIYSPHLRCTRRPKPLHRAVSHRLGGIGGVHFAQEAANGLAEFLLTNQWSLQDGPPEPMVIKGVVKESGLTKGVTGVRTLISGVGTLLITGRGPSCSRHSPLTIPDHKAGGNVALGWVGTLKFP